MIQHAMEFKVKSSPSETPMMKQYLEIKAQYSQHLVFYRMGDFYELFFDDAVVAAEILDIVLTKRGKNTDYEIPMCGVPAHSHEQYLHKLIEAGQKVAICDQLETPQEAKKRGSKALVRREVTRIITPGTILEDNLLVAKQNNYLCVIASVSANIALAWVDISTGVFYLTALTASQLANEILRIGPKEVIISERAAKEFNIFNELPSYKKLITIRPNAVFEIARCTKRILEYYKIHTTAAIANFSAEQLVSVGAMIEYLEYTQKAALPRVAIPKVVGPTDFMKIDYATWRNLELECAINGDKKSSLLAVLDKTLTAAGGRLLSFYLANPLMDMNVIRDRQDFIEYLITQKAELISIRQYLRYCPDMERSLAKVFSRKAGPNSLGAIRDGLVTALNIRTMIAFNGLEKPTLLSYNLALITDCNGLLDLLQQALSDSLPTQLKDGKFVRPGFNAQLDALYDLKENSNALVLELQEKYRLMTSIPTLKISCNNILGYFIEVTPSHKDKVNNSVFVLRQTVGSALRFTSDELRELEAKILACSSQIQELEGAIFSQLCEQVIMACEAISLAAASLAVVDCFAALAQVAIDKNYVRPLVDNSEEIEILAGKHPVVENVIGYKYVANDCNFHDSQKLLLITGPNMAGKSTFMRQVAIIVIMAQMGSFVPAKQARIGIVDKLFSRIGAGDDISRGQSTFMVEMVETASILNNATAKSLMILDEVGRGTATYDGLSIAWGVIEYVHNKVMARTLFATHYHELTVLEKELSKLKCFTLKVVEQDGKIIFLHKIEQGKADKSYGIHVAELAGLPQEVLNTANTVLNKLSQKEVDLEIS
jgi:DNA mismatch repair protein MutS